MKARIKSTGEIVEVEFIERKTHTDQRLFIRLIMKDRNTKKFSKNKRYKKCCRWCQHGFTNRCPNKDKRQLNDEFCCESFKWDSFLKSM